MVKDSWLPALDRSVIMGNELALRCLALQEKISESVTTQRQEIITVTTQEIFSVHIIFP